MRVFTRSTREMVIYPLLEYALTVRFDYLNK